MAERQTRVANSERELNRRERGEVFFQREDHEGCAASAKEHSPSNCDGMRTGPELTRAQWFEFALSADFGVGIVVHDDEIVFEFLAGNPVLELGAGEPLASDQAGFGDVLLWIALPGDASDEGVIVGGANGVADSGAGIDVFGALQDIDSDFEQGVQEADGLRPLAVGCVFVGGAELGGILSVEAGEEGMTGGPPNLAAQAPAIVAQGLQGRGEKESFGDGRDLGVKVQMPRLAPEFGEGGRGENAGQDLDFFVLEGVDLA
jgi:hypothetical protein